MRSEFCESRDREIELSTLSAVVAHFPPIFLFATSSACSEAFLEGTVGMKSFRGGRRVSPSPASSAHSEPWVFLSDSVEDTKFLLDPQF